MNENEFMRNLNLQQLREFVLNGTIMEEDELEAGTYNERIKNAGKEVGAYLQKNFSGLTDYDTIRESIYDYTGKMQDIYFEMGFISGARLMNSVMSGAEPIEQIQ